MSMYVERNLNQGENIIAKAQVYKGGIFFSWFITVSVSCLVFILILSQPSVMPILMCGVAMLVIISIVKTIAVLTIELAVTNKKIVGKLGAINTKAMDAPLNKVQNISVSSGLFGKMFGYSTIDISTASGKYLYKNIKYADDFKAIVMAQIDIYEETESKRRAEEMAKAMMAAQMGQYSTCDASAQILCPKCGTANSAQSYFCQRCGQSIK